MAIKVKDPSDVLSKALEILPISEDEIILSGVVSKVTERLVELKDSEKKLIRRYRSIEGLEEKIDREGINSLEVFKKNRTPPTLITLS